MSEANQAPPAEPVSEPVEPTQQSAPEPIDQELPEGDEPQPGDDDYEELEWGRHREKYRVPKSLATNLKEWRAEQTRKDEAIAAERKELEQGRESFAKTAKEVVEKRGALAYADSQLNQFANVNWEGLEAQDVDEAQRLWRLRERWKEHRDKLSREVAEVEDRTSREAAETTAKRIGQAREALTRDIPNWIEVAPKVADFAIRELGYSQDELANMADARTGKALHRAWQASEIAKKQTATPPKPAAEVLPLVTVVSKGAPPVHRKSLPDLAKADDATAYIEARRAAAKR